jgi:hypothetical protein
MLLATINSIRHNADDQPSFNLHTITGFHRLSLNHYYGFICHLTPTSSSNHFLNLCFQSNDWIRCQASLVTTPVPVRHTTLKHSVGLTEYWASRYFGRLPTNTAEAGSFAPCTSHFLWLPSDPTVSQ